MRLLLLRSALLVCVAVLLGTPTYAQMGTDADIRFAKDRVEQTRQQLQRLLSEYDLDPWIFTREVKVEAGVIPHSHPILTLDADNLGEDHRLLALFLHEQLHWFEEANENEAAVERAIEELKQMHPSPPDHEEIGTRSEHSTYLHLIVNWLELDALRHLVGKEEARTLTKTDNVYQWVNQRVLADTDAIRAVLEEHELIIDPTAE